MFNTNSTGIGLFSLRLSIFLLMILWAAMKIVAPESYGGGAESPGIFKSFYGAEVGINVVYAIGAVQIVFLLAFVAGAFKFATTGGVMLMNLASLAVSLPLILDPMGGKANILFLASVPVFGASLALFLMRKQDTFLSFGKT